MKLLGLPQDTVSYNVKAGENFFKTKKENFSSYKNLDESPLTGRQKAFLKCRGFNTLIVELSDNAGKKIKNVPIIYIEGNMIVPKDNYGLTNEELNQIQLLGTQFGPGTAGNISYRSYLAKVLGSDGVWIKESENSTLTESPCSKLTKSPGSKLTESPCSELTESPCSELTESQWSELTKSPGSELTESPRSELTESPWSKLTKSPGSELTKSPDSTLIKV